MKDSLEPPDGLRRLSGWLAEPEGTNIEFKEAKSGYDFEKLLQYCVAIANEGGGRIVLGATDRRPRRVVGTRAFEEPGRTEAGIVKRLGHRVSIEELAYEEHRVLVVHVPGRSPGTAWHVNGRYLKREGDDLVALSAEALKAIFDESAADFSAQNSPAQKDDLDPEAVSAFRFRWLKKSGNDRLRSLSDEQLLADADLIVDGRITYAALILLGTKKALTKHLAQAEVVFEYRSSEASGPAQDRKDYREAFMTYQGRLWERIDRRNERQSYQDDLIVRDVPTFDEAAVREALLNAIAHRDYRANGSVFVRQYAHRLEVVSPGGFPPGITADNIVDQQNPRNRRLAEALARMGFVERSGQGLNVMVETAVRHSKPLPSFAGTAAHEVRLTLKGVVQNPAFIRFLERIGEERLRGFSTHDFLTLDAIAREESLTEPMKARLHGLIEAGVIERQGRGRGVRHHLSRSLYEFIGRSGDYTRRRGLDRETNKSLLLKHLARAGAAGAPMKEMIQVLPALSRDQIRILLRELSKERRVEVRGTTRAARWFTLDSDDQAVAQNGSKAQSSRRNR